MSLIVPIVIGLLVVSFLLGMLAMRRSLNPQGKLLVLDFLSLLGLGAIIVCGWFFEVSYVLDIAIIFFLLLFLGIVVFVSVFANEAQE